MKLKIPAYYDKVKMFDKEHNSEINIFGVMLLFNLEFFNIQALTQHKYVTFI
jgi:hypothetical protein